MLAINGGKPVRDSFLPYGQQWISEEEINYLINVLKSPYITQGPQIELFEEKVANYVGTKYAVSFCNGTAALHAACYAAGIKAGDEVITSPITFVASANSTLYVGAKPIFADIDNSTYNISPEKIEQAITSKTKAIIAVDFTGQPVDYDRIRGIADNYGLVFIGDGAHSLGAIYKGNKVGTQADMTMFSFHPVKPITTAEGGIIVTDNQEYAAKLRLFRSHGITNDKTLIGNYEGPWYYEMLDLGMNYRMTDIQAALGISQIAKIDRFLEIRRKYTEMYTEAFKNIEGVIPPTQLAEVDSGWHLYILRLQLEKFRVGRREIFEALRAENIGVHVHYIPVYRQPYYQRLGYKQGICPIAEGWYEEVLTLPLFPKMTVADVETVICAVKKVLNFYYNE